jgi:hypothetical protein
MTKALDLTLISIRMSDPITAGAPAVTHVAKPGLRSGRGRRNEHLIGYLALSGEAALPTEQQAQLVARLGRAYFKTDGASTAALRTASEEINQYLLDRNRRSSNSGLQVVGLAALMVVRGDSIYAALSGPMSIYQVSQGSLRHYTDPTPSNRGLGLARTAPYYFVTIQLAPGDLLIATPEMPAGWDGVTLSNLRKLPVERMASLLLERTIEPAQATLLKVSKGSGKIQTLSALSSYTAPAASDISQPAAQPEPAAPVSPSPFIETPVADAQSSLESPADIQAFEQPWEEDEFKPIDQAVNVEGQPQAAPAAATGAGVAAHQPDAVYDQPVAKERKRARRPISAPLAGAILGGSQAAQSAAGRFGRSLASILRRILPDESILTLPSSLMAFIAVLVPLVIVTFASVVYYQRGREVQFNLSYAQSVQAAGYARTRTTPQEQSQAWQEVLIHLDQAERYLTTQDSSSLRKEAQENLDALDVIQRLNFEPALVQSLPEEAHITRIITTEDELYMYDAVGRRVFRAFQSQRGYELDTSFQCSAAAPSQLVDISPAVKGNEWGAVLLGVTSDGQALQCAPGKSPLLAPLAPPATGWGQPSAIAQDTGNLYILDPDAQAVWIYQVGDLSRTPRLFFGEQVPQLDDAVDLAADRGDLYILHRDGRTTLCTFSVFEVSPTRCTDPAPYRDSRTGRENQLLLPESPFTRLLSVRPPDPSLFLLAGETHTVYRFSLRLLSYDRQYRLLSPGILGASGQNQPATSLALTPDNRVMFLAFGNQLLYAGMP